MKTLNKTLKNEKGIALFMVLVLSFISLAITASMVYLVTVGTTTSGSEKRYKTALEASVGGVDIAREVIGFRGNKYFTEAFLNSLPSPSYGYLSPAGDPALSSCEPLSNSTVCTLLGDYDATYRGLETKLRLPTWCWSSCDSSVGIDPAYDTTYDFTFKLEGQNADQAKYAYNVYVKIIDATYGNSSAGGLGIVKNKVVFDTYGSGSITVPQVVYLYTVEILSQAVNNPDERARTSVLLEY